MKNKRKLLVVAMAGCLTLSANTAFSLGLGPVEVHSALGQPFHASIPFTSTLAEKVTPQDISARLASRDEHTRQGLPFPRMPKLKMSVNQNDSGQAVLEMQDTYPAAEPIVNMIVEVLWPGGRIFKTVTLLLDPPEYVAPGAPREIIVNADKSVRRSTSKLKVTRQADGNDGRTKPRVRDGKFIDVSSGDTLSEIAYQVYRQHGVDVITMMQVLFEHNPHAFGRNMHQLKAGVTLEIPQGEKLKEYVEGKPAAPVTETVVSVEEGSKNVSDTAVNETDSISSSSESHTEVAGGSAKQSDITNVEQIAASQAGAVDSVEEPLRKQQINTEMLKLRLNNQQLQDDLITLSQELKASNSRFVELQQNNEQLTAKLNELTETLQQADILAENGSSQNTGWLAMLAALLASVIAAIMSILWWRERKQNVRQVTLPVSSEMPDFNLSLDTEAVMPEMGEISDSAEIIQNKQNSSESEYTDVSAEASDENDMDQDDSPEDEMEGHSLNDTHMEVRDINPGDACFQDTEIRRIIFSSDGNEESKLLMLTILQETGKEQEYIAMLEKLLSQYPDRDSEMHQQVMQIAKQSPFAVADKSSADDDEAVITDEDAIESDSLSELDSLLASPSQEATDETFVDASPAGFDDSDDKTMVFDFADVDEITGSDKTKTGVAPSSETLAMDDMSNVGNILETDTDNEATELFLEPDIASYTAAVDEDIATEIDVLNRQELSQEVVSAEEDEATEILDLNELNLDTSEDRDYAPGLPDLELLDDDDHTDLKKQAAGK